MRSSVSVFHTGSNVRLAIVAGALAALSWPASAWAQDAQPVPPTAPGERIGTPGPGERQRPPMVDRDALRARCVTMRDNIDEVIEKIDSGAQMREVFVAISTLERSGLMRETREQRSPGGEITVGTHEARGPMNRGGDFKPFWIHEGPDTQAVREPTRDELVTFLEKKIPTLNQRLDSIRAESQEVADRVIDRLLPRIEELWKLDQIDPDFADLRIDEMRAGWEVVSAHRALSIATARSDAGAISQAKTRLTEALAAHFDTRVAISEHELHQLEKETERLRKEIAQQRNRRGELVESKAEEMIADSREDARRYERRGNRDNGREGSRDSGRDDRRGGDNDRADHEKPAGDR